MREVGDHETQAARNAIQKLQNLLGFPFTALTLFAGINEEQVSDVFVRINSQGKNLNQSDFILTLMSVFWDEGRTQLETFCYEARIPPQGSRPSPFNHFIDPLPDQLLRVAVGLGFRRSRLKSVYSILRGKDPETDAFDSDLRDKQFEILKRAQSRVLDLTHWHDFFHAVHLAGFRSSKMISSNTTLMFAYTLYLIGHTELRIDKWQLRKLVAQWSS